MFSCSSKIQDYRRYIITATVASQQLAAQDNAIGLLAQLVHKNYQNNIQYAWYIYMYMVHISTPLSITKHTNAHVETHFHTNRIDYINTVLPVQSGHFFCITKAMQLVCMQKFSNRLVYYFRTTSTFNHTNISNGKRARALTLYKPIQKMPSFGDITAKIDTV